MTTPRDKQKLEEVLKRQIEILVRDPDQLVRGMCLGLLFALGYTWGEAIVRLDKEEKELKEAA